MAAKVVAGSLYPLSSLPSQQAVRGLREAKEAVLCAPDLSAPRQPRVSPAPALRQPRAGGQSWFSGTRGCGAVSLGPSCLSYLSLHRLARDDGSHLVALNSLLHSRV